ncbi:hypothetical protein [Clostridium arbusti]|uniref:hypothetical protein n=1 Tax=Clostridium arbusti TaxID=1137848 RepID=UPI000289309E|nr:hypothetical protein [Clostridium arbusti]
MALYSVVVFLDINGYETTFYNEEIEKVVYNAAKDESKNIKIDQYIEKLSIWISKKCIIKISN